jgi:hypothetical protein
MPPEEDNDSTTPNAWLRAAMELGRDPGARVLCPIKRDGYLQVRDAPYADGEMFDRYLTCPSCGAGSVLCRIRVSRPES